MNLYLYTVKVKIKYKHKKLFSKKTQIIEDAIYCRSNYTVSENEDELRLKIDLTKSLSKYVQPGVIWGEKVKEEDKYFCNWNNDRRYYYDRIIEYKPYIEIKQLDIDNYTVNRLKEILNLNDYLRLRKSLSIT